MQNDTFLNVRISISRIYFGIYKILSVEYVMVVLLPDYIYDNFNQQNKSSVLNGRTSMAF